MATASTPQSSAQAASNGPSRVSVLVRSMDRPTLPAALDSIAAQTHRPLEIVLINALGTAHRAMPTHWQGVPLQMTAAALAPLRRPSAANAGLDAAQGDWVIFLDDDDVYLPAHLAKLVAALQAQPDAVAAHTDAELGHDGPDGWQPQHPFDGRFDPVRLQFENYLPIHTVLVNRRHSAALATCRFDESFDLFEDWDFCLQLAERGRFVHVPGVSARYTVAGDGTSGVFANSEAAASARLRLFEKWRLRRSPQQHAALLDSAQASFRASTLAQAQLALARQTEAGLRDIIRAREAEIAGLSSLRTTLAARDSEIASLKTLVGARDEEIANSLLALEGQRQLVVARETEIAGFKEALSACETELARLQAEPPLTAFSRALKQRLNEHR